MKIYDYISIHGTDGQDVVAKRVRVTDDVDRYLVPGINGVFIFAKPLIGSTELYAVRVGDREALSGWIVDGLFKPYFGLAALFVLGLSLSVVLVGIPILLVAAWGMLCLPFWKSSMVAAAEQSGFRLFKVKSI